MIYCWQDLEEGGEEVQGGDEEEEDEEKEVSRARALFRANTV